MIEERGAPCGMAMEVGSSDTDPVVLIANTIAETLNVDIIYYNAPLVRNISKLFIDTVLERRKRPGVILILSTAGGDPDAAYLIAKCLQCTYTKFTVFVAGLCKSAGTLVAIGAHDLIFSPYGELGPLDVQFIKKDELGGQTSGWAINSALNTIIQQASTAFGRFFIDLIYGSEGRITVQTAGKIAAELTTGLFSPICSQINPEFVGEVGRALNIASQYGRMLNETSQNLKITGLDKVTGLEKLISGYASHGFVIDGHEAKNIFNRVYFAEGSVAELGRVILGSVANPFEAEKEPVLRYLNDPEGEQDKEITDANPKGDNGGRQEAVTDKGGELISPPEKAMESDVRRTNPKQKNIEKKDSSRSEQK